MAEIVIYRDERPWSTWNVAKYLVAATLERVGLDYADDAWSETTAERRFRGTPHDCEAVEAALEGTGLRLERLDASVARA